jgi:hypothetical protein
MSANVDLTPFIARLPEVVNGNPAILRWGRELNDAFMLAIGETQYVVTVRGGRIESVATAAAKAPWRFALRAREECWREFFRSPPAPGWHDLFALLRRGDVTFDGDQRALWAYLLYIKLALAALRR